MSVYFKKYLAWLKTLFTGPAPGHIHHPGKEYGYALKPSFMRGHEDNLLIYVTLAIVALIILLFIIF